MRDSRTAALLRVIASGPFMRQAWAEAGYCLLAIPLAVVGCVVVLVLLVIGAGLTVSLIGAVLGLVLVVTATSLARALAVVHRRLSMWLLGEHIATPAAFKPGRGTFGRLDARLRDVTAWRATAYILAKLPVAVGMYVAVAWWATAVLNLAAPVRWGLLDQDVPLVAPLPAGGNAEITTAGGALAAAAIGVGTLLAAPWLTRAMVAVDRWLRLALLAPGELAARVKALEETRAQAVDDATAQLRRLEHDLHDGPQVRLVAMAMSLNMAQEKLAGEGEPIKDPDGARRLVATAHRNATETLTELRDLSRGIHPPDLDDGLRDAVATLAARSALPVELSVEVPIRPTPAIETMAYYCVAELLANTAKHSGARSVVVTVIQQDDTLRLRVRDDGSGGARTTAGGGLTGLQQRIRTVDGRLHVSSPDGGPTAITVALPMHA